MKKIIYLYAFLVAIGMASCSKDETEFVLQPSAPSEAPTEVKYLKEVANFTENEHKISIKTINGKLYSGYNDIYIEISDKNTQKSLSATNVTFLPMMRMYKNQDTKEIGHSHSCPHTADLQQVSGGLYRGYAVFQMYTGKTGHWDFTLNYAIGDKKFEVKEQKIEITAQPESSHLKFKRFKGKDEKTYILALISPEKHKAGNNSNVILGLFRAESMVSFPLVKDFTIEVDPRMPGNDMKNHSTPFEKFSVQTDGFYKSSAINYSMTGDWTLNFIIKDAQNQVVAGSEVPKNPTTEAGFNAKSELFLDINIEK